MAKDTYYFAIDIGTSSIRSAIAVKREHQTMPDIIGVGVSESLGIRKGVIVDSEETVSSITAAIEAAEYMAGEPIDHAYISIGGAKLNVASSKGVVAIASKNGEITANDVNRVIEVVQNDPLPQNKQILRVIPKSFTIDDQEDIKDPVGMSGIRLEAHAHIVTTTTNTVRNLTRCIHQTGIDIDDLVPVFLAASESTIGKKQKELGIINIDFGGGSTSIAIYEEGSLLSSTVIPIGSSHITNDLAIGLRTSVDVAEKIKIEYGSCLLDDAKENDKIDISHLSSLDNHIISRKQVVQIIQARIEEILSFVYQELQKVNKAGMLPAGAILTGGGAKLAGLVDFTKELLGLPVQIGYPIEFGGLKDRIDDPEFATVTGLLLWSMKSGRNSNIWSQISVGGMLGTVKGFFKSLLP